MLKRFSIIFFSIIIFVSLIFTNIIVVNSANEEYHFGFKRGKDGNLASISQEGYMDIFKKYDVIFLGDTGKKELYLTFDNGYENGYTTKVLDILKEKQVPAAFFVTGHYVTSQPDLIKRMVNEGHIIGNHTWGHPNMTKISDSKIEDELNKVFDEVSKITGVKEMKYVRPPKGIFNEHSLAVSKKLGYTNVFWSIAYADWDTGKQKGEQYAYDRVMSQLHPGAVILLHTVSKDNADALAKIIDDARKQGYVFKSLDQIEVKSYN